MNAPIKLRRTAYRLALDAFRRLPPPLRRLVVRAGTPHFTVGAVCAVIRDDRVLLLRQRHRAGWTLPGGLLDRGENAETAVRRELGEELRVDLDVGLPVTVFVDGDARRVDIIYRVDAPAELTVKPRGEAVESSWLRFDEIGTENSGTLAILGRLRDSRGGSL